MPAEPSENRLSVTHICLVCADHHHVQAWDELVLRNLALAPLCTARLTASDLERDHSRRQLGDTCFAAIWAVDHEGEPRRYVGRPPQKDWQSWANCIAEAPRG